jgi:hypothetical protein
MVNLYLYFTLLVKYVKQSEHVVGSYNVGRLKLGWEDTIRNYCEPTGNKCDIVD